MGREAAWHGDDGEAPVVIDIRRRFSAPAEQAFDAWIDPAMLGRWMFGPAVRDEEIVRLSIEPRPGGCFSFVVKRQGQEFDHTGEYFEVKRPQRLVFSWGVGPARSESCVTIEIVSGQEGCDLMLTHAMHPKWREFADRTRQGWVTMLGKLDAVLRQL